MAELMVSRGHLRTAAGILAGAVLLLVLLAGSVQARTFTVDAVNYKFLPESETITVGDVVHWTFAGEPHWVTARDGSFDSGQMNPGGSYQFRFSKAGTYPYYCRIHPEEMVGTIVVRASATPKPTVARTPRPTTRPTATPGPTPTPASSPAPSATPSETAQSTPSAPATATAGASVAIVETPPPSIAPASPNPDAGLPAGASDPAPVVLLGLAVVVLVGGGLIATRRRRPS